MNKIKLVKKKYYIETLLAGDVTEQYVNWLNDPEVNRFLEVRFVRSTLENVREYVKSFDSKTRFLFGIFTMDKNQHIGNIALYINTNHNVADFGYLIGEKEYWGRTASTEACALLFDYAFKNLNLRKVWGGVYPENIGSIFNYKKMGFTQEARLRNHVIDGNKATDVLIFSMLKEEWIKRQMA